MNLFIDTRATKPIYVQIMDELRRLIVLEELKPHDVLPSVRQLAADLKLNHNTIVQAYRELERDGAIYVKRGQGTFVAERTAPEAERERVLAEVVDRAITDAQRHGITPETLVDALRTTIVANSRGVQNG